MAIDLLKNQAETLKILGSVAVGLITSCMWINGKFNDLDRRLVRIETVLVIKSGL